MIAVIVLSLLLDAFKWLWCWRGENWMWRSRSFCHPVPEISQGKGHRNSKFTFSVLVLQGIFDWTVLDNISEEISESSSSALFSMESQSCFKQGSLIESDCEMALITGFLTQFSSCGYHFLDLWPMCIYVSSLLYILALTVMQNILYLSVCSPPVCEYILQKHVVIF